MLYNYEFYIGGVKISLLEI